MVPRFNDVAVNFALLVFGGLITGCGKYRHVRQNLSLGEVTSTAIIRTPARGKSWGILPKYDEILEGYIRGGVIGVNGQPIQGITVRVQDLKGIDQSNFIPGITDNEGVYKIRFSVPVRWGTVDFTGVLVCESGWRAVNPQTEFRLYYDETYGVLAYSPKTVWMAVMNDDVSLPALEPKSKKPFAAHPPPAPVAAQPAAAQKAKDTKAAPKKSEDGFDDFSFGPD